MDLLKKKVRVIKYGGRRQNAIFLASLAIMIRYAQELQMPTLYTRMNLRIVRRG